MILALRHNCEDLLTFDELYGAGGGILAGMAETIQCYKPVLNCLFTDVAIGLSSNLVFKKMELGNGVSCGTFCVIFRDNCLV